MLVKLTDLKELNALYKLNRLFGGIMDNKYEIYPLSEDRLNDFLYFFDNAAFADHQDWKGCYCTFYHILDLDVKDIDNRDIAVDLIKQNKLCGYLAYSNNNVVGWCNTANKKSYPLLISDKTLWDEKDSDKNIKSVVCFTVAPAMRSKGVAAQLLEKIYFDAKNEDYDYLESYPAQESKDCFNNYRGPVSLYKKFGFELSKEFEYGYVYRKKLK